jgi:hypothetical protein
VLDRERILAKIDELEGYLHDLRTIALKASRSINRSKKSGRVNDSSKSPWNVSWISAA